MRKRAAVKASVTQIKQYIDNLQENVECIMQMLGQGNIECCTGSAGIMMVMNELDQKSFAETH
jgi:hypothetical protein